jgi:hypothetical protein
MGSDASSTATPRGLDEAGSVINVGLEMFGDALREQGAPAVDVDWRVPAGGDPELVAALTRLHGRHSDRIADANAEVARRLDAGQPLCRGIGVAGETVPAMDERTVLHAGPALPWERFPDPLRRAVRAALVAEGWSADVAGAEELVVAGEVALEPATAHDTVVPMATALGPSAPVWIVENPQGGNCAYAPLSQGPGQTQWMGVETDEAIEQLRWLRDAAAPVLQAAWEAGAGPLDVLHLASQALEMGDDVHVRVQASTALLGRHLAPHLAGLDHPRRAEVAAFLSRNYLFFLTLAMGAAKSLLDWADEVEGSSIVTGMTRNGATFGVRLAGERDLFVADAPPVAEALYRGDHGTDDAAPDIGDSAVIELVGLGGAAAAASPAVAALIGGSMSDAVARTRDIALICDSTSSRFRLATLDYRGTPLGVDARLVTELEVTPAITTGILHARDGVGQIGAGVARAPLSCFQQAVRALDARLAHQAGG